MIVSFIIMGFLYFSDKAGVNVDFTFCKLVLGDPSTANRTPAKQVEHTEYTVSFF